MISELLFEGKVPVLNNRLYLDENSAKAAMQGQLEIVASDQGYLVNRAFDKDLINYDKEYQNEQNYSQKFLEHLEQVQNILLKYEEKKFIEIGCGKGFFLEKMANNGIEIEGFDPTYNGINKCIKKRYFDPQFDSNSLEKRIYVMRHVLEHIPEPFDFLKILAEFATEHDLIFIEVPSTNWIVENNAFFDFTYEHVNYFLLENLKKNWSEVIESGFFFNDQYLYLLAKLKSFKKKSISFSKDFLIKMKNVSSCLSNKSISEVLNEKNSVIWGCAGKGVIWGNYACKLGFSEKIKGYVDINPEKWGKYVPASGTKCLSPQEIPSGLEQIVIANPNYEDEIKDITRNKYHYVCI